MTALLIAPILLPLLFSTAALFLPAQKAAMRRGFVFITGGVFVGALALLGWSSHDGVHALQVGAWPAPFGITVAVDLFSALMLVVTTLISFMVAIYAQFHFDVDPEPTGYYPLLGVLLMGVNGAILTGDLFNLYVWIEVLLMASFVLLALGKSRAEIGGATKYVALNLISSSLFLAAAGLLYGMAGTLNMAELAQLIPKIIVPARQAIGLLLLAALAIKAAAFPFFMWLPAAYPTAPPVLSALFSGLLTKVGVYAMIRMFTLLFPLDDAYIQHVVLSIAGLSMVTGVLGALAQNHLRRLLSFHIVSQIGYMILGLGLFTEASLAAAIFYMLHNMVAKTNLILVSGAVRHLRRTEQLDRLGDLYRTHGGLAVVFLLSALSLAGVPPLAGFVAKLAIAQAAMAKGAAFLVTVALIVGMLTVMSMTKIWGEAFWKPQPSEHRAGAENQRLGATCMLPMAWLAGLTVAFGVGGQGLLTLCERAAAQLLDRSAYIQAVMGTTR